MDNGWIKIHRKIMASKVWGNSNAFKVWMWCLLKATHDGQQYQSGLQTISIEPGQFVFGRIKASEELKLPQSTVRNLMNFLQHHQYVDIKTTNKYSVVTIINWDRYQNLDNKRTTKGQQKDTYKNDKNVKNNIYSQQKFLKTISDNDLELIGKQIGISRDVIVKKGLQLYDYCDAHGKRYKNYKAFLVNCLRADKEKQEEASKVINLGGVSYADIKNNR